MGNATVKVVGVDQVIKNIGELITGVEANVLEVIGTALKEIKQGAQTRAPVASGEYRKSFRVKNQGLSGWVAPIQQEGGKDRVSRIGHLIEFGTAAHGGHPGTPPKPHLFPAFEEVTKRMGSEIAKALKAGSFR